VSLNATGAGLMTGSLGYEDDPVIDLDQQRLERLAQAWAAYAHAVGDAKLRTMHRANDPASVCREKAIGHPIQRRANMRAGVNVHIHDVALANGE
jgi:hypothetical protein